MSITTFLVPVTGRRSTAATDDERGPAFARVTAYNRDGATALVRQAETVVVTVNGRTTVYDEFTIVGKAQRIGRR